MPSDLRLSDDVERAWMESTGRAGSVIGNAPSGLDDDMKLVEIEDRETEKRRSDLMDKYGWALADTRGPQRHAAARRAAKSIKDPEDREWLLGQVAEASKAVAFTRSDGKSKKGFVLRVAERLYELPQEAAAGGTDVGESFAGLGRVIGGGDKDKEDIRFQQDLEGAYQSADPEGRGETGAAWRATRGGARIAPQVGTGAAAFRLAGKLGLATQAALQSYAPIRERMIGEGASPVVATSLASLAAGLSGAIETAVPVPGLGKSGIAGVGRSAAEQAAVKAGLGRAARKVVGEGGRAAGEFLGEVAGEEAGQAAVESAASLAGAAISGETKGRSVAEIPGEALEAVRAAAGPMLPFSLIGGGVRVAKTLQSDRFRKEAGEYASGGRAPSRGTWKKWGFAAKDGESAEARLRAVSVISEALETPAAAEVSEVEAPAETQPEAPRSAEAQIVGFQTSTELAKAFHTADAETEGSLWYQKVKSLRESGLKFSHILEQAKRRVSEPPTRAEGEHFPAEMEETIRQGIGPAPADWHVMDSSTPVPTSSAVEVAKFGDRGYWRMNVGEPSIDRRDETGTVDVGVEQPPVEPEAESVAEGTPQKQVGFLADESGSLLFGERGDDIDDTIAGMNPSDAVKVLENEDPDIVRRKGRVHGMTPVTRWQKFKDTWKAMGRVITRANEFLPNDDRFNVATETWRLAKAAPAAAQHEAIRRVAAVVGKLGPTQERLFGDYLMVKNMLRGMYKDTPEPRRFGYKSIEQIERRERELARLIEDTPAVKEALQKRGKMVRELATSLVRAKLLPESALDDVEHYVHQQVLMYAEAYRRGMVKRGKKSFQRHRVHGEELAELPEEFDPNTSYIEPEVTWMADAFLALRQKELNEALIGEYDRSVEFAREAETKGVSVRAVAKERGYDKYVVTPAMLGHSLSSLPAQVVNGMREEIMDDLGLNKAERDLVNEALGGGKVTYLPNEIIEQLEEDGKTLNESWLTKLNEQSINVWKAWTIMNPLNVAGYNLRNYTGDLDPVFAADPKILLETANAWSDLRKLNDPESVLSDDIRMSRDYGVIGSGWVGTEVSDLTGIPFFRRFNKKGFKRGPVDAYKRIARGGTEFRENLLRHSAFLRYKRLIERGELKYFGASKAKAVEDIKRVFGIDAAAARMSRDLFGDYGNMTVMGNYLRAKLLPFWAWNEINIKRFPRLVVNALHAGAGSSVRLGAVKAAVATVRVGQLYGMLWAWNNLLIPAITGDDDEKDLPPYDRANPHILLGRNSDGTVRNFRNVGAVGDLLEWFGINEALAVLPKLEGGQIDWSDIGKEMLKAPLEKVIGLMRPDIKAGFEVATGTSLFPSALQPRSVARDEAVAGVVGLVDEYKAVKGRVLNSGDRERSHYFQRWMLGVVDPRATALNEMYDLRMRYLQKEGKMVGGIHPISEYKQAREAAINDDREAFNEWRASFVQRHGGSVSVERFGSYLRRVDPIAGGLSEHDELVFEREFLSNEQREQLRVAREYSAELRDRMLAWWIDEMEK